MAASCGQRGTICTVLLAKGSHVTREHSGDSLTIRCRLHCCRTARKTRAGTTYYYSIGRLAAALGHDRYAGVAITAIIRSGRASC